MRRPKRTMIEETAKTRAATEKRAAAVFKANKEAHDAQALRDVPVEEEQSRVVGESLGEGEEQSPSDASPSLSKPEPEAPPDPPTTPLEDRDFTEYGETP